MHRNAFRIAVAVAAFALASTTSAQLTTAGSLPQFPTSGFIRGTPATIIDFTHPATADGSFRYISVGWVDGACPSAFKVKVLRPAIGNFSTFSLVGERGPFDALAGVMNYQLTPSIDVKAGDLLAITQLNPTCGEVGIAGGSQSDSVFVLNQEITGSVSFAAAGHFYGSVPAMQASTDPSPRVGVIPIVGDAAGNFGSHFRTSIQLHNPTGQSIRGKMTFHPLGKSASSSDVTASYLLTAHQTTSQDFGTIAKTTGLFSVDIATTASAPPVITTRVYNDTGAGTSGFFEDAVILDDALHRNESATITLPDDLLNYRLNVGVRSLSSGATLNVTLLRPDGSAVAPAMAKPYTADFLEQSSAQQFLGGTPPVAGGTIVVTVTAGSAIVYSTTTDNRTNDSALKYAKRQ